jgi:hypothetical protein
LLLSIEFILPFCGPSSYPGPTSNLPFFLIGGLIFLLIILIVVVVFLWRKFKSM